MRILEEFWYGNIEPTEYDTSSCKEYKKLLELICRNEEMYPCSAKNIAFQDLPCFQVQLEYEQYQNGSM